MPPRRPLAFCGDHYCLLSIGVKPISATFTTKLKEYAKDDWSTSKLLCFSLITRLKTSFYQEMIGNINWAIFNLL